MPTRRALLLNVVDSCRSLAVALAALLGSISHNLALAEIGDGAFSFTLSNESQFLDTTIVDPLTLQPLPADFSANEQCEFSVSGLIVLDGDAANPLGRIEFSGQCVPSGSLTVAQWNAFIQLDIENSAAEAEAYFASLLGNVDTRQFAPNGGSIVETTQQTVVTAEQSSLEQILVSTRPFLGTPDGKEAAVPDADVSGLANLPGFTEQTAGPAAAPDLPADSNASAFSFAAFQHDLAVFSLSSTSRFSIEALAQMAIRIAPLPGDFDGDGDVDGDDFLVWQAGFPDTYNGDDFLDWQKNFGTSSSQANSAHNVPEPSAVGLLAIVGIATSVGTRRSQRLTSR